MKVRTLINKLAHVPADAEIVFVDKQEKEYKVDGITCWNGGENAKFFLFEDDNKDEQR